MDAARGKARADMPALKPYRGKPPYGILGGMMETWHHAKPGPRHRPTRPLRVRSSHSIEARSSREEKR